MPTAELEHVLSTKYVCVANLRFFDEATDRITGQTYMYNSVAGSYNNDIRDMIWKPEYKDLISEDIFNSLPKSYELKEI